jgi:hypothetical protein
MEQESLIIVLEELTQEQKKQVSTIKGPIGELLIA